MFKTLKTLLCIAAAATVLNAQESGDRSEVKDLSNARFETGRMKKQGVSQLFSSLAFRYDIPIGLELARHDDEDLGFYTLDFKGGSLGDLMTEAIKVANGGPARYVWELKDGAVYIFPEDGYRDPALSTLLQVEVAKFSLNKNTACGNFVESLAGGPDMAAVLKMNGMRLAPYSVSGFYIPQMGRDFGFEVENMPLRSILDKAIKESPTAKFWVIGRNSPDTFRLSMTASFEDTPKEWRGLRLGDFFDLDPEWN